MILCLVFMTECLLLTLLITKEKHYYLLVSLKQLFLRGLIIHFT